MITFVRWLLFPFTLLYASIVWFRNRLFDVGWIKSTSFDIPVVIIGNLAVGGTGKSPMTEYILRILNNAVSVAVLSRGYGRKTKGFRWVKVSNNATEVGDEPLQIKRKFPDTPVAVCEDRVFAVKQLEKNHHAVLLDDAFQHRALRPSYSILLFDYQSLLGPIIPLPTGNFRDLLKESRRADIIVVTKCPNNIDPTSLLHIKTRLEKHTAATIFYANITYMPIRNGAGEIISADQLSKMDVLAVTGIANPSPMLRFLEPKVRQLKHISFPDHHSFSTADLQRIDQTFVQIDSEHKMIVTTEKDYQRLPESFLKKLPIYILPIEQRVLFGQSEQFEQLIKQAFERYRSVN
ncbi:tetraacyldisaccharide 4'-kinase [Sphingobacterium suaedae]|uniref:Tetraacyldisaccharide 4'-kinase n=1 Tax=Sphingobacterium suaedae TaxID=1686402 RepID=A0ABW5KFM4_9SPHI